MHRRALWIVVIAIALTPLEVRAQGESHPSLVPWKVLELGAPRESSPLTLYWVPATRDELRRSDLLASDELTLYSSQCVAMRIVRLNDRETLDRLGVSSSLPVVVLTDARGAVIARAGASVTDVEGIVREELDARAEAAEKMLDEAADKAEQGDVEGAKQMYREVSSQRCVCPRQGKAAQRALKRMGK